MIGASFGSVLALELASKLEGDNMTGDLIMLDGGPDYLKHPDTYSQFRYMEDYATQVIAAMVNEAYPENDINYELLFAGLRTMEQKIEKILNYFKSSIEYQIYDNLLKIFLGMAKREKFYKEYDGGYLQKIESKILLVRVNDFHSHSYCNETYGLNRYARHDVAVKFVEGNHITMYENPELAQIVNEAMDAI
jgi:fatty acid synthase